MLARNNQPKVIHVEEVELKFRDEIPADVLASDFDWLDPDPDNDGMDFFQYHDAWYHTQDFMATPPDLLAQGWDGCLGETYFSAVLITLLDDGEHVKVGKYVS